MSPKSSENNNILDEWWCCTTLTLNTCFLHGDRQLQPVRMPPSPRLFVKTWGGGGRRDGAGGGGGIGSSARGDGLRTTRYYRTHTSMVCVCLGPWGYRGMYALIAISWLCHEESPRGLEDQRHSTPFKQEWDKKFGALGAMALAPLSFKTRGEGGGRIQGPGLAAPPCFLLHICERAGHRPNRVAPTDTTFVTKEGPLGTRNTPLDGFVCHLRALGGGASLGSDALVGMVGTPVGLWV